jgi:hypothetical protein
MDSDGFIFLKYREFASGQEGVCCDHHADEIISERWEKTFKVCPFRLLLVYSAYVCIDCPYSAVPSPVKLHGSSQCLIRLDSIKPGVAIGSAPWKTKLRTSRYHIPKQVLPTTAPPLTKMIFNVLTLWFIA